MNPTASLLEEVAFRPASPAETVPVSQPKTLFERAFRAVRTVFQAAHETVPPSRQLPRSLFEHETNMLDSLFGKRPPHPETKLPHDQLHQYCKNMMSVTYDELGPNSNLRSPYLAVKHFVSQVAFLAKNNVETTANLIQANQSKPFNPVKTAVNAEVAKILTRLEDIKSAHIRVGLQSPEHAYFVAFHLEIMKALIMPDGSLNVGLIPTLIDGLLNDQQLDLAWKKQTRAILQQIAASKDIQSKLTEITIPDSDNRDSKDMIRITLGLDPEAEPTVADARIVAGTGITPNRQGPVGNCFVECNIDWFQRTIIGKCFEDFGQLIKSGELIRKIGSKNVEFPFVFDIADNDLQKAFAADKDGKLSSGAYIWESPGIQSSCKQLGIKDVQAASKQVCGTLFDGTRPSVTPRDFLLELAKLSPRKETQEYLGHLACVAFNAVTNAAILHALASSMATMDQCQQKDSLHRKLAKCWGTTFNGVWEELKKTPINPQLITKVSQVFNKQITGRMNIRYDESIETPLAADGSSTAGSYVYFEHDLNTPDLKDTPIHTYTDLTNFALHSLQSTDQAIQKGDLDKADIPQYQQVIGKVRDFISKGDAFASLALSNYDPSIKKIPDLKGKWTKFTSFGQIGGDNANVFEIAYGMSLPDPIKADGNTARERLVKIIEFLRDRENKDHFLEHPELYTNYEMDTDDHALLLNANNPSIKPFIQSTEDINKMIDERIVAPCQAISNSAITSSQKDQLLNASLQLIPQELNDKFTSFVENCNGSTVHEYAQQVWKEVLTLNPDLDDQGTSELLAQFTNIVLYQVLTPQQLAIIQQHTVSVPDTNWEDDDAKTHKLLEIYFGFTLNIESNELELVEIDEDNSNVYSLSQTDWVQGQGAWNLYGFDLNQKPSGASA